MKHIYKTILISIISLVFAACSDAVRFDRMDQQMQFTDPDFRDPDAPRFPQPEPEPTEPEPTEPEPTEPEPTEPEPTEPEPTEPEPTEPEPTEPEPTEPEPTEPEPTEPEPTEPEPTEPEPTEPEPTEPEPTEPEPTEPEPTEPEPISTSETFQQKLGGGKVDILFVVDNSDSMYIDHRHGISQRFRGFVNSLQGIDYQIGVTTTDIRNSIYPGWGGQLDFVPGTQQRFLTSSTPNAESRLLEMIHREEVIDCRHNYPNHQTMCGSNWEQPLKATMLAIDRRNHQNQEFFRDDANLIVIVLTDENEDAGPNNSPTTGQDLINHVRYTWSSQKSVQVHGIIIEPGDNDCLREQRRQEWLGQGAEFGTHIAHASHLTGGKTISICKSEYVTDLNSIAEETHQNELDQEFTLAHDPLPGSVQIQLSPQASISWTLNGRTIRFAQKPAAGTNITVQYLRAH